MQRVHARKRKAALLYDTPLGRKQLAPSPEGRAMPQLRPTTDERRSEWMRVRSMVNQPTVLMAAQLCRVIGGSRALDTPTTPQLHRLSCRHFFGLTGFCAREHVKIQR